jgi:hypothetical protein
MPKKRPLNGTLWRQLKYLNVVEPQYRVLDVSHDNQTLSAFTKLRKYIKRHENIGIIMSDQDEISK